MSEAWIDELRAALGERVRTSPPISQPSHAMPRTSSATPTR